MTCDDATNISLCRGCVKIKDVRGGIVCNTATILGLCHWQLVDTDEGKGGVKNDFRI